MTPQHAPKHRLAPTITFAGDSIVHLFGFRQLAAGWIRTNGSIQIQEKVRGLPARRWIVQPQPHSKQNRWSQTYHRRTCHLVPLVQHVLNRPEDLQVTRDRASDLYIHRVEAIERKLILVIVELLPYKSSRNT